MIPLALPIRIVLLAIVLPGGYFDFRFRRIPNWLTVSGLAAGLAVNATLFGLAGLKGSVEGFGLALLIYIPLYLLRGMGAGDVKMMAAVGAIVGPANWLLVFLATCLLGGVAAVIAVLARKRFRQTWFNVQTMLGSLARFEAPYSSNPELDIRASQALRLPHGVVIAGGAVICIAIGLLRVLN